MLDLFKGSKKKKDKEDANSFQGGSPALSGSLSSSQQLDDPAVHDAKLHPDAHPEGGLACTNEQLLKEQREAITAWIASMGRKVFSGNLNLLSTPMPVTMFESRSYLEKLTDVWVYPEHLQRAAAAAPNPVERLSWVVTWFVAGLHHGFERWKKPFNPILGETFQGALLDGSRIAVEQISHHPPVSAWVMEGPGGSYTFTGLSQPTVSLMFKYYGFKTTAKGSRTLSFPDGTQIDIQYPGYYIKGVVYSTRPRAEVDGHAVFTDVRNGYKAVLRFGPNKGSRYPVLRRTDAIMGEIYDIGPALDVPPSPTLRSLGAASGQPTVSGGVGPCGDDTPHGGSADSDSEGFETASESDWELREVRSVAEAERDVGDPMLPANLQRTTSRDLLMGYAGAAGTSNGSLCLPPVDSACQGSRSSLENGGGSRGRAGPSAWQDADRTSGRSYKLAGSVGGGEPSGSGLLRAAQFMSVGGSTSAGTDTAAPGSPAVDHGTVVARIEGSWLSHLNINSQRYWTLREARPDAWQPLQDALPSDCRFRDDLVRLKQGNVKDAQVWKEALEEAQRRDKKLRQAGGWVSQH